MQRMRRRMMDFRIWAEAFGKDRLSMADWRTHVTIKGADGARRRLLRPGYLPPQFNSGVIRVPDRCQTALP